MRQLKTLDAQQTLLLRLESQLQHLQAELTASTISNQAREELLHRIAAANEQLKDTVAGRNSLQHLERVIEEVDLALAHAVIEQAEHEIPKREHRESRFQALELIKLQLVTGNITTAKARREVKNIIRHH